MAAFFSIGDEVYIRHDYWRFTKRVISDRWLDKRGVIVDHFGTYGYYVEFIDHGKKHRRTFPEKILAKELPRDATIPW